MMGMEYILDAQGEIRLAAYIERIGLALQTPQQRESFAVYAMGLMGDGERKSAEPMAARACADPDRAGAAHQRLTYFTRSAPWSDRAVRREAARYAIPVIAARERVCAWIIDDTGFLKQGSHSVGVQRQYTGSAGKVTNCQVGVSLSLATPSTHLPVDFALYLPTSWTEDPVRRAEAHLPADVQFKTKPELALDLIKRAVEDGLPPALLLADSAYGDSAEFRRGARSLGLDYAVGIHSPTTIWRLDTLGRCVGGPVSVGDLAIAVGQGGFRKSTWRAGTKGMLSSRFYAERVVLAQDHGVEPSQREDVWLLIEWPDGEDAPTEYTVSTLPARLSRRQLVRRVKERWRTERVYEDAKGELGLDHFEGRTFPGWHHHVSVVLACFAFIVAERQRAFPPSGYFTPGQPPAHHHDCPNLHPPGATLCGLVHHNQARHRARPHHLAAALSALPPPQSSGENAAVTP
jgi:SRSO17 transposase